MWIKTDHGDWVNLDLVTQVRFGPRAEFASPAHPDPPREEVEPDHATLWCIDGQQVVVTGSDVARLRAAIEGKPPKNALVGAYRKG